MIPTDKVYAELIRQGATTQILCPYASEPHFVALLKNVVGAYDMRDPTHSSEDSPELPRLIDIVRNGLRGYWDKHHPDEVEEE
jgi:hypothetical protein